jgi:small subunit ribosomal protein S16
MGKIRNPQYRIVVADSRTKRDGRAIEEIGLYHPKEEPSRIEVKSDRAQYWLSVGAQPSQPVRAILSKTGDWQKFKGLPPPAEPLRVAPPRADRTAIYEAEAQAAAGVNEMKPAKKSEPARKTAQAKAEPAKTEAKAEAKTEAKAEAKTEAKVEPKAEAKTEAKAEPKAETKAEPTAEPKTEAKSEAKAEPAKVEAKKADEAPATEEPG